MQFASIRDGNCQLSTAETRSFSRSYPISFGTSAGSYRVKLVARFRWKVIASRIQLPACRIARTREEMWQPCVQILTKILVSKPDRRVYLHTNVFLFIITFTTFFKTKYLLLIIIILYLLSQYFLKCLQCCSYALFQLKFYLRLSSLLK